MPYLLTAGCAILLTLAVSAATPRGRLSAQQATQQAKPGSPGAQAGDTVLTPAVIDSFARTHAALASLRDRYQALFAEPRNKTREEQEALQDKLIEERVALLKAHGFTESEFSRLTRRVSADSAARRAFDEALLRLAKQTPSPAERVPLTR